MIRIGENDEDYALGDIHALTGWIAYELRDDVSVSLRAAGSTQGDIDGRDPRIMGPVQTANPDFHGGERIALSAGLNLAPQSGVLKGHRLAFEIGLPVYQDLNGPQMEADWTFTVGWQKSFSGFAAR